jgi:hypothetical protein
MIMLVAGVLFGVGFAVGFASAAGTRLTGSASGRAQLQRERENAGTF